MFTAVEGDGSEVQYVTMTQEEAEAAGVEDDDQVYDIRRYVFVLIFC